MPYSFSRAACRSAKRRALSVSVSVSVNVGAAAVAGTGAIESEGKGPGEEEREQAPARRRRRRSGGRGRKGGGENKADAAREPHRPEKPAQEKPQAGATGGGRRHQKPRGSPDKPMVGMGDHVPAFMQRPSKPPRKAERTPSRCKPYSFK